ncbi:MAG TPA: LptF/LptG family permease [Bryobacteraceae bacterium]|nr:LptF/LptG family permease [Bryobacteraceae bacterium]
MGLLSRSIFREVSKNALFGAVLFTFVLFLQRAGKLFAILVRSSAPPATVAQLFGLAIPFTLTFTVPLGVLVGVLLALSRMSGDGEIVAMRACGVPSRKTITPVLMFATLAMLVTATASLWLTPYAAWRTHKVLNQLSAAELTSEVQEQVFDEGFPNKVVYISEVSPGAVNRWRNVFIADATPPEEQKKTDHERGEGPTITVAASTIPVPDVARSQILLSLQDWATYDVGKDPADYHKYSGPTGDQVLEATKPSDTPTKGYTEIDTIPLYRLAYHDKKLDRDNVIQARIELHQRLALPPACFLLALVGIPLGISSRKGGKSPAFVFTVALAFVYWMGLIAAQGLAKQQALPVGIAMWIPNTIFAIVGLFLLTRLERPGDRDLIAVVSGWVTSSWARFRGTLPMASAQLRSRRRAWRTFLAPQVVDSYVLKSFLFWFVLLLIGFVLMTHVYTFFDLLSDIVKNHIAMSRVFTYLFFLTPQLIFDSAPISVLVAVLITFGVLTKHNEITALKASGVSLYRLAVPVLAGALLMSGALFAFAHYYVPDANRKQDAIRKEIKGKAVQTYLHPDKKWVFDPGSNNDPRVFYFKFFDGEQKVMVGPQVFELDASNFRVEKHISAEKARWEPALHTWIFENGWSRQDPGGRREKFTNFAGQAMTFPEIDERPDYFLQEVLQDQQMNYQQLAAYIRELKRSGIDTIALQVSFYRKFALPLFALVMALISVPFAFLTGNRGAMAGVGVSFAIAIAYWAIGRLFEQLGDVNLLPAVIAAWSPDVLFAMAGMYFFTRMRT